MRLLKEEVFCYLTFLDFLFSWTLEVSFNICSIHKVFASRSRAYFSGILILISLSHGFSSWFVANKLLNIYLSSKLSKKFEFFLFISIKVWKSLMGYFFLKLYENLINSASIVSNKYFFQYSNFKLF